MPDTRLPSTRDLAARLAVACASVVVAYEQLLAEGYIYCKIGSGTYISSNLPEPIGERPLRPKAVRPPAGDAKLHREGGIAGTE
jgi:GntR family transcriptional regulator / MocR family aminotransferase